MEKERNQLTTDQAIEYLPRRVRGKLSLSINKKLNLNCI